MFDSKLIADRFLQHAEEDGATLTPMQLLKLVYIAHGWMLGLYNRPLIRDEVQAWQYGPVIPRLYNAVRKFKDQPVKGPLSSEVAVLPAAEAGVVKQVYDIYGEQSGPALSNLTHQPNSPWAITYKAGEFGIKIPNDIIAHHYARLAQQRNAARA